MGKRIEKVLSWGASVAAAINVVDKVSGWWTSRREAKAEVARVAAYRRKLRDEHRKQKADDLAALNRGVYRCTLKPDCRRPNGHAGDCGPPLGPWQEPMDPCLALVPSGSRCTRPQGHKGEHR